MGKVVGLVGAASGKIGNLVYAVTNGIQTARVYQPIVYNPKSGLQSAQRAKGNLAGRISSYVPRTAIMGLGENNRARRGAFLSNILRKADVVQTDNSYNAKIDQNDVVFSRGNVTTIFYAPELTAQVQSVQVSLAGGSSLDPKVYESGQGRLVVMIYDLVTQELVEVVTRMVTKPVQGQRLATTLLVAHPTGYLANVYLIPMSTADGSSVSVSTDLATLDDNDIAAALSLNRNAVIFNYGKSIYLGQTTYTPA